MPSFGVSGCGAGKSSSLADGRNRSVSAGGGGWVFPSPCERRWLLNEEPCRDRQGGDVAGGNLNSVRVHVVELALQFAEACFGGDAGCTLGFCSGSGSDARQALTFKGGGVQAGGRVVAPQLTVALSPVQVQNIAVSLKHQPFSSAISMGWYRPLASWSLASLVP